LSGDGLFFLHALPKRIDIHKRRIDADSTLLADFFHGLGDNVADSGIVVGRDGTDLGDIFLVPYRFGHFIELFHHQRNSLVDAPFYRHGTQDQADLGD
jgi:hypothetical protein